MHVSSHLSHMITVLGFILLSLSYQRIPEYLLAMCHSRLPSTLYPKYTTSQPIPRLTKRAAMITLLPIN